MDCTISKNILTGRLYNTNHLVFPYLGVGESTIPQIKWFFEELGLRESDWFDECQAVYKFGNYKYNWNKQGDFLPLMFEYDNQRHYGLSHLCREVW